MVKGRASFEWIKRLHFNRGTGRMVSVHKQKEVVEHRQENDGKLSEEDLS